MKTDMYDCRLCYWTLNDLFLAGLLGLVPARLPQPHSLQCVRAFSAVAVTASGTNFEYFFISHGSVAIRFRCGGVFNDLFIAKFLENGPVKNF